jgi:two-component system phosphate regulon response regulator PhoB
VTERHALVVEDDPAIRVLYAKYLSALGFRVETADTGEAALALLERARPELISLDAMLPEQSGYSLCEAIRARPGGHSLKILMISARAALADRVLAEEVGADLYLVKPVSWADFAAAVRSLTGAAAKV